ncbi:type II secretion system F family protein [Streptomyces huasconensis]|uniref:type II secretion system F family protein n=1 Tax=Streptomyces huasconensis TaxID=1854574 RepID=UPI0036F5C747
MWAAAVCAGSAAWLMEGRDRTARRVRAVLVAGAAEEADGWSWRRAVASVRARVRSEWGCLAAGAVVGLLGESLLPLAAGAAGVPVAARVRRARGARRERERRGDAVIALCGALAGEVRAGRQPGEALRVVLGEGGAGCSRRPGRPGGPGGPGGGAVEVGVSGAGLSAVGPEVTAPGGPGTVGPEVILPVAPGELDGAGRSAALAAARFGGDVPGALAEAAREPGAEGLLGLAACWRVAVDRGAGLAAGLERLEGALRVERDQRADLRAQLAGARSTAVMLAGLPVLGLLMGSALGADPLRVLLHTGAGLGCLVTGGVLEGAGMWWALRIVRGAEGR